MDNEDRPLAEIFNDIFRNLKRAENDDDKVDLKKNAVQSLSLKMKVQSLGIFSSNESIDEVSSKSLKYLLCAYFEGYFRLKMHDSDPTVKTNEAVNRYVLKRELFKLTPLYLLNLDVSSNFWNIWTITT